MSVKIKSIVVTGPTATGKTALAVKIAALFDGEIISVDSRQVYRGMDIGSGKDLADYRFEGLAIPYHMIDIADPREGYNLKEYCIDAQKAFKDIAGRGRLPVFCGGTAMYLNAILSGYTLAGAPPDLELRQKLESASEEELLHILRQKSASEFTAFKDFGNRNRLIRIIERVSAAGREVEPFAAELDPLVIAPYFARSEVHARIESRLDARLQEGMVEEVDRLHREGVSWEQLEFFGLEYRYVARHLQGKLSLGEMRELLFQKIRQFAKRQDIWFRKLEREGLKIYWITPDSQDGAVQLVKDFLAGKALPEPGIRLKEIYYGPKN